MRSDLSSGRRIAAAPCVLSAAKRCIPAALQCTYARATPRNPMRQHRTLVQTLNARWRWLPPPLTSTPRHCGPPTHHTHTHGHTHAHPPNPTPHNTLPAAFAPVRTRSHSRSLTHHHPSHTPYAHTHMRTYPHLPLAPGTQAPACARREAPPTHTRAQTPTPRKPMRGPLAPESRRAGPRRPSGDRQQSQPLGRRTRARCRACPGLSVLRHNAQGSIRAQTTLTLTLRCDILCAGDAMHLAW